MLAKDSCVLCCMLAKDFCVFCCMLAKDSCVFCCIIANFSISVSAAAILAFSDAFIDKIASSIIYILSVAFGVFGVDTPFLTVDFFVLFFKAITVPVLSR